MGVFLEKDVEVFADEDGAVVLSGEGMLDVVVFLSVADGLFDFLEWHAVIGPQGADGEGFDEVGEADASGLFIQDSAAAHWLDGFRPEEPTVQRGLWHPGIACRFGDGVSAESFDGGLERGDHVVRRRFQVGKGGVAKGNPGGLGEVGVGQGWSGWEGVRLGRRG